MLFMNNIWPMCDNITDNRWHPVCVIRIKHYKSKAATEKMVHTFIVSRFVHHNSLLYGLPRNLKISFKEFTTKLTQKREIWAHTASPSFCSVGPVWLRIQFKPLLLLSSNMHVQQHIGLSELTFQNLQECLKGAITTEPLSMSVPNETFFLNKDAI